uniref:Apolipoprotein B n=1 Tax=Fundulus heteroclitus TaxID=8078 RepID=A0A3Q2QZW3_FUNHE
MVLPIMGYSPLCLLLLLSSYSLARKSAPPWLFPLLIFKVHRKYVYQYSAESRNGAVGSTNLQTGPKVTCEVEIEVPQMCRFIMHTRGCTVSEASTMDPQGEPIYSPAPGSDAFKASMEKSVQVYPEADEPVNILNVKRGILSALLVPVMEDGQKVLVSTVHGRCLTAFTVRAGQDGATDVRLSRDLSQCDQSHGRTLLSSPVALLQRPVSKLMSGAQSCRYRFDERGSHISAASCTEKHTYLPFSQSENGVSSVVTQVLNFQSVKRISSRTFGEFLFSNSTTKDAVLSILQELAALATTDQGQKRTSLFHKLVSSMRVLRNETLSQTVAEMVRVSHWLTFQALFQCGTTECTSAIMQVIWTVDGVSLEVDALVYALGLQANPDAARVRDMLSMAEYKQSKAIMYALANTVKRFYKGTVTPEIREVSMFMEMILNGLCLSPLQVVGVMGRAMQDASPALISSVLRCMKKSDIPLSNQRAAIQAFMLMDITAEVYQNPQSPVEVRLAAYQVLMKNPDHSLIREITNGLKDEKDEQLKSFVLSHLYNILNSADEKPELKELVEAALQDQLSPTSSVFSRLSKNYKLSSPLGSVQSNIIFDDSNTLPKELKLEASLKAFDRSYDMLEVGLEGAGFEPTIKALLGERGFLPETFSRLMKLAGDSVPMLRELLDRVSAGRGRNRRQVAVTLGIRVSLNFQKLLHDVRFSAAPEATAVLRLLGDEVGYMKTSEMRTMLETLFMYYQVFIRGLPAQLTSSTENELFFHYIFMETSFSLPTAAGFPLKLSLSGVLAAGARGGLKPSAVASFMPSVGVELITRMGVHLPDYVDAGTEMHTNLYHESSLRAKASVKTNQIKVSLPAPESNIQLLSVSNKLLSISAGQAKAVLSLAEDRVDSTDCQPLLKGLNLCTVVRYSNASSTEQTPYFPLTGEATGRPKAASVTLSLKAEGTKATAAVRYDHNKNTISTELVIPDWDVEAGINLAVTQSDRDGRRMRGFTVDVTNKNIPQLTLVGRASMCLDFISSDDDKVQVELKTDLNAEVKKMIPNAEEHLQKLQKLIDDILDQKVAKTDMKLRHIVTKGIEVEMPSSFFFFYILTFLVSFNKEKIIITLPLPLGGKTSEELNLPKTLFFPTIDLPQIGLHIPAKKYVLPSFSVPNSLGLTIPLLGLAEASTKIHSNLYNWEGSISGGNNTVDIPSYAVQYKAMAQSPISLLSYKLEGAGMISERADDNLKYLLNCSFSHMLLDTSFSIMETLRVTEKLNGQANYKFEASSPLGLHASLQSSTQYTSTLNSDDILVDGTLDVLLKLASFQTNASYSHSYNLRPLIHEGRGESTLRFDSPFIKFQNMIQGVYANSELNVVSKTRTQKDVFKHVAELRYKDAQLTLKCNAVGLALGKSLNNIVEFGLSRHMSIFRIESQADDDTSRVYSLITGSLSSNGMEVNSEGSLTFDMGRALHKVSVRAGGDGLTFTGTNNIQCSPVTMENTFDGAIGASGASFASTTKVMAEEGRGELNIEGRVTSSEAFLYGDLKGHAYDAATTNNMKVILNRRALTFTSNTKGTLRQMTTESSHELTLTLWTLSLRSKSNNFICEDLYYRQNTKVDVKPFVLALDITNKLRFYDLSVYKEGHMKLEPLQVKLGGTLNGAFREQHNIQHTYELTYKDMSGSMKYSTSGNITDAQLSHKCELEFAGFSSNSKCEVKLNSEPLRFGGRIAIQAVPFSLAVDSSMDSDGEINLHGKHSGQMFSTLLVKTAPLAVAWSHDCRVLTKHRLPSGESSTNFNNKFEGLLTPKDQSLQWKVNSKLNNHGYEQSISAYNNPEKVGLELSAVALTDFLSRQTRSKAEAQNFSMAGFLKYDKNSNCHIIEIPLIESFPVAFERLKSTLVHALESLQQFILNLDINQLITNFRANLDKLPIQVKNFMRKLDLENKVDKIKERLDYLINEFALSMDDLELGVSNLRQILEKNILDIVTKVHVLISKAQEFIKEGHLSHKITAVLSYIGDQLHAFDAKYKIKQSLVKTLDFMEDIVRQMDLQKLRESSAAFLHELDLKYGILQTIKEKLSELKKTFEDFNLAQFVEGVKNYLLSVDWASYVEQLSYQIPVAEISRVMESINEVIVNWIDEYEIPSKLNAVHSYFKDILLKYELDNIFKDLMDQAVILVKEWKIEDTVHSVVQALNSIKLEIVYDKLMSFLYHATSKIRELDFKKSIDDLNDRISSILDSMKDFDYGAFIDETNVKIVELTNYLNEEIKKYEIVNKIEAVRQFFREIQNSIYAYLDELKNTKVADALKKLKDVTDTAFYNDVKLKVQDILEDMRQRILDMDIRDEIQIYLQRASDSYKNMAAFFSAHFKSLMEWIKTLASDNKAIDQMKQAVEGVLEQIKRAEIKVATFTVPLTDLVIPGFTINLNKLQEITIPTQISVPEFTILSSYTVPAFTVDFNKIKTKIVGIIDDIRGFQIQTPDMEDIFGNLKVLYLPDLPDLTFPEIALTEIRFPAISIPKLNVQDSEMRMLTIPDVTFPEIPTDICIPVFGKLHGEFSITSPQYELVNKLKVENSTSDSANPKFTATFTSHANSPIEALEHTFETMTQLEAPRMENLLFTQSLKVRHAAFSVDHEGSLTLPGSPAEVAAKSTTVVSTQFYTADLVGSAALSLQSGISAVIETTYNHKLDLPILDASSQLSLKQSMAARMESGSITVTGETSGTGKWSIQDLSDEGTHRTNVKVNVGFSTAKLTCAGEIDYKGLKAKHTLTAESAILSDITVEAQSECETPFVKTSVMFLNGEAHVADLKAALSVSHEAEFTGDLAGTMSNSLEFKAHPFEILVDVNNKVNSKVLLPLKLTSRVDLQHDYGVAINSEKQRTWWFALARFNQYKYSHNVTAENSERDIYFQSLAEGEANLEFLTIPLSFPEMTIPYLQIQTPEVRDFSLWEDGGLKSLLFNSQQSFDMDFRFQYHKNPDLHRFELHLEPIYNAISDNFETVQGQFEACRDKVVSLLKHSYHEAKAQYIKHKIDTSSLPPKIFRVPGYKIPILDIQVSAFRAEMPAFSFFVPKEVSTPSFRLPALGFSVPSYTLVLPSPRFPVIRVPESLSEIKLPSFTLPAAQDSIVIPALGNITCDFSFKSPVITLNANAGLYNESDIVARFGALSVSEFDVLNGKIDGTTSLTRTRGLKLASTVTLEHSNVQANHECSVSLTKRSMEASAANSVKIHLPFLQMEMSQELTGNTRTKLNVLSKKKLSYMFNFPQIASAGKGSVDMSWNLEALSSHVLLESSTQAKSDIMTMDVFNIVGSLEETKTFFINVNGLRTTEKQKRSVSSNLFLLDLGSSLASDVSLRRVYTTVQYNSNNKVHSERFSMSGRHGVRGELDLVPLKTLKTKLRCEAEQSSSVGDAGLSQDLSLAISSEKQSLAWSLEQQLGSVFHSSDWSIFNEGPEAGMTFSGSLGGHLAFLKSIKLPAYQRTLWDVLKMDEVTNINDVQFFNFSSALIYTKSSDGYDYQIPSKLLENGVTFIPLPSFHVPFTSLHMESFTVDPENLNVPTLISTKAFDILLPGLPVISVPSWDVSTEYLQDKMSFLTVKIPQHEIRLSSFTLPKSVTIGDLSISLDDLTGHISNFKIPDIVFPEQKVEIPEIVLHLPSSIFIPSFGALSATFNISSPVYKVSTTAAVRNKDPNLESSLSSYSTSTVDFMEYDLTGKIEIIPLNRDLFARECRHTLDIDITSRTFTDASVRFAARRDSVTASGLNDPAPILTTRCLNCLCSHLQSTPGKDTNILTAKASLKNSEKLVLQTSWNWDSVNDFITGFRDRIPLMTSAVLKFINKHHTSAFGFDLSRGGVKLRNSLLNLIDRVYQEVLLSLRRLQQAVQTLADRAKDSFTALSDSLLLTAPMTLTDLLTQDVSGSLRHAWNHTEVLLEATTDFLRSRNFSIPGYARKPPIMETFQQSLSSLTLKISEDISRTAFTLPGTNVVVNGSQLMGSLRREAAAARHHVTQRLQRTFKALQQLLAEEAQRLLLAEEAQRLRVRLRQQHRLLSSQVRAAHSSIIKGSRQHADGATRLASEGKDLLQQKVHELHRASSVERLNSATKALLGVLQSNLSEALHGSADLLKEAPYIRVGKDKLDVEVPLPFLWKSFSEWPTLLRR